jgi:hypothetical protein
MKNMLRGLILEALYEAGMLQPVTNEAKSDMEPATAATVEALAKLGLKKSEAHGNKEMVRKALEPVIDRYGDELKGQLIGVGGALLGFVGIDKKGQIHPLIKKLFNLRGMTSEKLKGDNPELYTKISQIGPFIREVAYDLHHNWGESGFFGPKAIKAYMASKQGGGSLEEGEGESTECSACDGSGQSYDETCVRCGGRGQVATCTSCGGKGSLKTGKTDTWGNPLSSRCKNCSGSGQVAIEDEYY